MKKPPDVSILMPVFNEELYLHSCIESIIKQSFRNWELIIVDDFSSDDSFSLLGQFANNDQRIKLLRNKEKGIIPALKLAFANTSGRLITRMDADDIMPQQKLERLSSNLRKLGSGNIVSGKVKYFSDGILNDGFLKYEHWINEQKFLENIYKECTLPSACWMAFKSDLLSIDAFNSSQYPEDYDLLFKFYEAKLRINGLDDVLHLWRDHPLRASRTDPNYADQNFFSLKVEAFKKIDLKSNSNLYLWGAGKKGKALAVELVKQGLPFRWVTQNQKKIGKHIYDVLIEDAKILSSNIDKQIITAISDRNFQDNKSHIIRQVHFSGNEYYQFC